MDAKNSYIKKPVHVIFEEQVLTFADKTAIRFEDTQLSYEQLNSKANQLAHYLRDLGVQQGDYIGIFIERSLEMVISFLAVLKSGGVYVPLDPVYPKERLEFMIEDTQISKLITHRQNDETSITQISLADISLEEYPKSNLNLDSTAEDLAYIMYTSGSTGRPKGICIPHKGIVRLVKNTNYIDIKPTHIFAQISNACFDAATFEIWGALLNGGQSVIIARENALVASRLKKAFTDYNINVNFITTALFNQFVSQEPKIFQNLDYLLFGGEGANTYWVQEAFKNKPQHLMNVYGPTENTTFSTYYCIEDIDSIQTTVPIGKAISYTETYVLNSDLQPVVNGEVGELYLGGMGLAHGYLNRPQITEKAFVKHPDTQETIYKTGDLVRLNDKQDIEYIGRIDHQVKIRGFRIEMGEIENSIAHIPGVNKTLVVAEDTQFSHKKLVAYVEQKKNMTLTKHEIRNALKAKIPDYMIPSDFVIMDKLPINENGKIDRKAIAKMDFTCPPPKFDNETQSKIYRLWQNILSLDHIELDDNFFEVGGNSLLATQMVFDIQQQLGCSLPLESFYSQATIKEIAELVTNSAQDNNPYIVLLKKGTSTPIFLFPDLAGDNALYADIIKYLSNEQTVYCFRPIGIHDEKKPLKSIAEMAEFYIEQMKKIQPQGPYILGGLSMAGTVAFEVTQKLNKQQDRVSLLFLLDTDSGLDFSLVTLGNVFRMLPSVVHNIIYQIYRPKKLNNRLIKDTLLAIQLIYNVEISPNELANCKTEQQQYECILHRLKQANKFPQSTTIEKFKKISDLVGLNFLAVLSYFPKKYQGKVVFFKPTESPKHFTAVNYKKWHKLLNNMDIHEVPGNHFNFFLLPSAETIGKTMQSYITKELQ
ncbi:amino acid adenylation domain-containing protein [Candidatus Uabimicrobium amorphum]|uniref:Peptide synthetase n=1 Tax=Uabimicrobium amorphum TaxID=2596890 RepID=A0A5S9IPG8_UABAM|nr:amino acid adenylation domain-containing protein [Candidatus Uabimicrobium amorphum]BBM85300.1 peptide synthetase [Candidatus Uabimicrobium amorphum]